MPTDPLSRADLRYKFMLQAAAMGETAAARLFERLENLEAQPRFSVKLMAAGNDARRVRVARLSMYGRHAERFQGDDRWLNRETTAPR